MPKAVRLASAIAVSSFGPYKADADQSDLNQFVSIALFSGTGLLVSLMAILCGVQGAWY
jgi:hypothetical protein